MVSHDRLTRFQVGNSYLVVSHLQFSDDTLFIGEATVDNLSIMKSIMRWFYLISRLKVNFHKSSLMAVNREHTLLDMVTNFLIFYIESVSSKYLGLLAGA